MAYNQFIKVDQTKVNKLPFIQGNYQYYYRDGNDDINLGILYEVNEVDYDKILERLQGLSTLSIQPGNKVYIMSGCKIPLFKIKDHCKKIGATITSDVNNATFFVGNPNIFSETYGTHNQNNPTCLIMNVKYPQIANYPKGVEDTFSSATWTDTYDSIEVGLYPNILLSGESKASDNLFFTASRKYFITPLACMILYNTLAKSLPIINEDLLLEQVSPVSIIDEDVYDTIYNMLKSSDEQNQNIGCELLANSDIKNSLYWIWKLSLQHRYTVSRSRIKNVKLFINASGWGELASMDAEQFIQHLYKEGVLTKELFKLLINDAMELHENNLKSDLFVQTIKPSEKFKEFAEETDVVEFRYTETVDEEQEEYVEEEDNDESF
jgi:uncharacterized protein Smg (DUF494 family)